MLSRPQARICLAIARFRWLALAFCALALAGCAGQVANIPPPPSQSISFGHVFIVLEENASFGDVIANPGMPYLNGLASQYGLATNYFANAHPSTPNYFEITSGQTLEPLTLTDAVTPHGFPVDAENVVRELLAVGKTWKSYAEDLPTIGYTGDEARRCSVAPTLRARRAAI